MFNISILSYLYRLKNHMKVPEARMKQYIPKYPFLLPVDEYNIFFAWI